MRDEEIRRLRRAVGWLPTGNGRRYSAELKAAIRKAAEKQRLAGASWNTIATMVGMESVKFFVYRAEGGGLLGHSSLEMDGELEEGLGPGALSASPSLLRVADGKEEDLQGGIVVGERSARLECLAQMAV